jgi:DNA-binding protein Fis
MERKYIGRVLAAAKGNKTLAARILGISRTTLREKLKTGSS